MDYGAILRVNGKFINKNKDLFMDSSDTCYVCDQATYFDDESKEIRTTHINGNFYVYAGDENFMLCFYKGYFYAIHNNKIICSISNSYFISETIYFDGLPTIKVEHLDKELRNEYPDKLDNWDRAFYYNYFGIKKGQLKINRVLKKYKNTYYIVTDTGIYVSGGAFSKTYKHKPFAELSHVDLHRGIFDQMFNVGDIITTSKMNSSSINVGGWPGSAMRSFVNDTIYNALPEDLRNVIADTYVVSSHGSSDSTNFTSTDKLYLLSTKEVWGKSGTSNTINYDTAEAETRQLDYYTNLGVSTDNYSGAIKYNESGSAYHWWLRSAGSGDSNGFYGVSTSGDWGRTAAIGTGGVAPAFRLS